MIKMIIDSGQIDRCHITDQTFTQTTIKIFTNFCKKINPERNSSSPRRLYHQQQPTRAKDKKKDKDMCWAITTLKNQQQPKHTEERTHNANNVQATPKKIFFF